MAKAGIHLSIVQILEMDAGFRRHDGKDLAERESAGLRAYLPLPP